MSPTLMHWARRAEQIAQHLRRFPWQNTLHTLRERFREDRLGLTASSLTFTTTLALVPFVTVALAVFTAFPVFGQVQNILQRWLVQSLIPETISRQVLGYLTQFSAKASGLGVLGLTLLLVTALALILTMDRTFNNIWRVQKLRPLGQRVLIYWAALTLGPLLLGLSLALTTSLTAISRGYLPDIPGGWRLVYGSLQFMLLTAGMAGLYRYVPNTRVDWRHAWSGGLFVAVGMEVAKKVLSLYLAQVPTYSVVFGAFATVPILLVWIYVAWIIVLLGAVVAAYLPSLLAGVARRGAVQGWTFQLALEVLQKLDLARGVENKGCSADNLALQLQVDTLQIKPVLEALVALDWVGQLAEEGESLAQQPARYVLLSDLQQAPLAALIERLLLDRAPELDMLWQRSRLDVLTVAEVLPAAVLLSPQPTLK